MKPTTEMDGTIYMSELLTITETAAWLKNNDNYLILTHRRPDGDTLGSAGALAQGLREAGKTAWVRLNTETTPRYARFVEDHWAPGDFSPDHVITVDIASTDLFTDNCKQYINSVTLCIDHHRSNTRYAGYNCIDGASATCGEMIYDLLIAISGNISAKSAECLYTAVSTDTGCFAFGNTTADTLRISSLLIKAGAPHRELNRLLFRTKTRSRISIEGMINSGLEYYFGGAVAVSTITRNMIETTNASEDDLDNIASIPGSVEGVLAGITIREMSSPNDCKVSVRTNPAVDAHAICAHYGGGGHRMAAGFTINATVPEIKETLLETLRSHMPPK